jgi:localization factor PodJL
MQLAAMLFHGQGIARDVHKALYYYQDAAEAGIAYAQHRLARLYLDGERVPRDPAQALSWMLRAAQQGFVEAQLDLSELYANGQYMDRDLVNAHKWLAIAASLTDQDLDRQQGELEEKMSFVERIKAGYLARSCMLKDYKNC